MEELRPGGSSRASKPACGVRASQGRGRRLASRGTGERSSPSRGPLARALGAAVRSPGLHLRVLGDTDSPLHWATSVDASSFSGLDVRGVAEGGSGPGHSA